MSQRIYWQPTHDTDTPEAQFFKQATVQGFVGFFDSCGMIGAEGRGRQAEMIPRGGRERGMRRYWEVLLSEQDELKMSCLVDGFSNATSVGLDWLKGSECLDIAATHKASIVERPGRRRIETDRGNLPR